MYSVKSLKEKLPHDFLNSLYDIFSPCTVDKILMGLASKRDVTLRVNTLKYDTRQVMQYLTDMNIKFQRNTWFKDALSIKNVTEKEIQKLNIYENGGIYLQSLPSMMPPLVLQPRPGDNVLDLTAAPGGKTTQIAAIMKNKGYVLANEMDKIRFERLKYNVEKQGASIVEIKLGDGSKLGNIYKEKFDKVLLDAPCSGEGRFLASDVRTYKYWSKNEVIKLVEVQKKLFKSAYTALKPGGTMVYSTCTLNFEENEKIIDWALDNFNLKTQKIELEVPHRMEGISEGVKKEIKNSMRILPNREMEGFFICKLYKSS
ncbi:RsmB/NOP family class I SAM-dependent RNA methyltransferase [Fervidicella metallireducens]|uniref:RsmB/NOP family class I SAM-dependent RNA methyltransferase n=1 Tax=Fervidicella metallireducens TaxID=655338 RepID=UPI00054F8EBB|nr:RsmB/NOP family class I SAM-dependent RNA methyltransferase [Fervidicella metallireducens]